MPFWKKDSKKDSENGGGKSKEKINYRARLEHKQYLVIIQIHEKVDRPIGRQTKRQIDDIQNKLIDRQTKHKDKVGYIVR